MVVSRLGQPAGMRVVHHRPWLKPLLIVAWVVSVLLAIIVSYWWSEYQNQVQLKGLKSENQQLQNLLSQVRENESQTLQQLVNLKFGSEIDRQAAQDVRAEVVALQDQITELENEIRFYRGLMAPGSNSKGVGFGKLELHHVDGNQFHLRIVVQQVAANHQLLTGSLQVALVGLRAGNETRLPINEISEQVSDPEIKLRFKYFQVIEADLVLPEGFMPRHIDMNIEAGKYGSASQTTAWQVQES